jgi:hypothetical protein
MEKGEGERKGGREEGERRKGEKTRTHVPGDADGA